MERIYFKKLVRDGIPGIIESKNGECETRILDDKEFDIEARKKLTEEAKEVVEADQNEVLGELADVMELVRTIAGNNGYSMEQVEQTRVEKNEKRGGFEKKIFLEWATDIK